MPGLCRGLDREDAELFGAFVEVFGGDLSGALGVLDQRSGGGVLVSVWLGSVGAGCKWERKGSMIGEVDGGFGKR